MKIINNTNKKVKINLGAHHEKEPICLLELEKGESYKFVSGAFDLIVIEK